MLPERAPAKGTRVSPPFESDISKVADAGGVGVVAVAEHRDIDQVCGCGIIPDLGIDAGEIDLLVEPAADPIAAGVGNEVREAADVLLVPGQQSGSATRNKILNGNLRFGRGAMDSRRMECPARDLCRA